MQIGAGMAVQCDGGGLSKVIGFPLHHQYSFSINAGPKGEGRGFDAPFF